jgi:hypothetical protein
MENPNDNHDTDIKSLLKTISAATSTSAIIGIKAQEEALMISKAQERRAKFARIWSIKTFFDQKKQDKLLETRHTARELIRQRATHAGEDLLDFLMEGNERTPIIKSISDLKNVALKVLGFQKEGNVIAKKSLKNEEAARRDAELDKKESDAEKDKSLFKKIMAKKEEVSKDGGGFWAMLIAGGIGAIIGLLQGSLVGYLKGLQKLLNFKWITKLGEFFTKIKTGAIDKFRKFKTGLLERITKITTSISNFFGKISKGIKSLPFFEKIGKFIDDIKKINIFKGGDIKGNVISKVIGRITSFFSNIKTALMAGLKYGKILGAVVGKLFVPIQLLIASITGLIDGFKAFNETDGTLLEKVWEGLKAGVGGFIDVMFGWIPDALSWIASKLGLTKVAELIDSISLNPFVWIETIITFFKELGTLVSTIDFGGVAETIKTAVLGFVTGAWDWIVDGVKKFFAMSPVGLISGAISGNDALQNIQREVLKNVIPDPNKKYDKFSKESLMLKVMPDSLLEFVWGSKPSAAEGAAARGSAKVEADKKAAAGNPEAEKLAAEIAKLEADRQKFQKQSVNLTKAQTDEMDDFFVNDKKVEELGKASDSAQRKANQSGLELKQKREELNLLLNGQSSADQLKPAQMDKPQNVDAVGQALTENGAMNSAPTINVVNNNGGNVTNNTSQSTQNSISESTDNVLAGSAMSL